MGEPRSVLYCTVLPAAEAFLALGLYWSRPQIAGDPPDDDTPQAELDHFFASMETAVQVRKTPSWPRSWANFSLLYLHSPRNAWTNSHLLGQPNTALAAVLHPRVRAVPGG